MDAQGPFCEYAVCNVCHRQARYCACIYRQMLANGELTDTPREYTRFEGTVARTSENTSVEPRPFRFSDIPALLLYWFDSILKNLKGTP